MRTLHLEAPLLAMYICIYIYTVVLYYAYMCMSFDILFRSKQQRSLIARHTRIVMLYPSKITVAHGAGSIHGRLSTMLAWTC